MKFIKNSVIAKVVSVSIISISISMAILTFLVVNNSFDMMKTNTEKTVQKELSLLIENINTFSTQFLSTFKSTSPSLTTLRGGANLMVVTEIAVTGVAVTEIAVTVIAVTEIAVLFVQTIRLK